MTAQVEAAVARPLGLSGRIIFGVPPQQTAFTSDATALDAAASDRATGGSKGSEGKGVGGDGDGRGDDGGREGGPRHDPFHPSARCATLSFPAFEELASARLKGGFGLGKGSADDNLLAALGENAGETTSSNGSGSSERPGGGGGGGGGGGDGAWVGGGSEDLSGRLSSEHSGGTGRGTGLSSSAFALSKLRGKEHLLDLRLWNHADMRRGCCPAANGLATADGLACFADALASARLLDE